MMMISDYVPSSLTANNNSTNASLFPLRVVLYNAATGNMALCFPDYVLKPDINSFSAMWTSVNTPLATVSHIQAKDSERMSP
jgi:hypothetical protein